MEFKKEQIDAWKKQHGDIYLITVEDKSCVLRKPTRQELSFVSGITDPMQFTETLLKQLWLGGDEDMQERDEYFLAISSKLDTVLKLKEAEVKKL
ncbi:hypothetical protein HMPREF9134_00807 [Porphyromonas catoniae F0037]|jgi:hypothetical protein|uniref:Uncharacterized protein n=1 Tax=Porphyromonas catoniae F0037 TaxID=1127696 RepID=L1NEV0_9PORP|nr:hypothetical protein [Porphyromonas catoniae]EKY01747.1 hypothetical protein HMPREF9134_00807 [Porphyromonas catoniae F0037]